MTLDPAEVRERVSVALQEDLRSVGDPTSAAIIDTDAVGVGRFTARATGVLAGLPVARAVLDAVVPGYRVEHESVDGKGISRGDEVLVVRAPVRGLLTAERTALNYLCHLSGVATHTAAWVDAVAGTGCRIRDTRKTIPGLRQMQKYAVRCGGGVNHRLGLWDAVLIKDNHVVSAGSITAALAAVRERSPGLPCEVEVDTLEQLDEAFAAGADEVLLDNFTPSQCAEAVRRKEKAGSAARLESSGGLSVDVARAYAESGVDYLAVGALTHSSASLDLALDLD